MTTKRSILLQLGVAVGILLVAGQAALGTKFADRLYLFGDDPAEFPLAGGTVGFGNAAGATLDSASATSDPILDVDAQNLQSFGFTFGNPISVVPSSCVSM